MAAPTFVQSGSDPLFFLTNGSTVDTCAYLPAGTATSPISQADAWSGNGYFLFFGAAVTDQAAFVTAFSSYLQQQGNAGIRFVWITNPDDVYLDWEVSYLSVNGTNTASISVFDFGGYTLRIGNPCPVTINGEHNFQIGATANQAVYLETQNGQFSSNVASAVTISCSITNAGALGFELQLQAETAGKPTFETLDVGCRYYVPNANYDDYLDSLHYALWQTSSASAYPLYATLDPTRQLDADASYFAFSQAGAGGALTSNFLTNLGQPLTLTPAGTSTKLVFALRPRRTSADAPAIYTLVPDGEFAITLPASSSAAGEPAGRIMAGFSGIEYMGAMASAGNSLHFFSGQPAYAGGFQAEGSTTSKSSVDANAGLTNVATTSWVYITPGTSNKINYYAQPDANVFFQGDQTGTLAQYLDYLEVQAGVMCAQTGTVDSTCAVVTTGGNLTAFPMVPYLGTPADQINTYKLFEQQILSPARRAAIQNLVEPADGNTTGDPVYGATPTGLVVTLDTDKSYWRAVTLAHTEAHVDTGAIAQTFQFTNITGAFRAALQTNQLMLVAVNQTVFQTCASARYEFTRTSMAELNGYAHEHSASGDTTLQDAVENMAKYTSSALPSMMGVLYDSLTDFNTALSARVSTAAITDYGDVIRKYCSSATLAISAREHFDLSSDDLDDLSSANCLAPADTGLITTLRNSVVANHNYATSDVYETAIVNVIGQSKWDQYAGVWTQYGKVADDGWYFNLAPDYWPDHGTIMIIKHAGKSLQELVNDNSTWAWPEVAAQNGQTLANTQATIQNIIDTAKEKATTEPDFAGFVKKVDDPNWNGILFLNAEVPVDALPAELQGLSAGIDPAEFFGHHIGVNITPVENEGGVLTLRDSSLFGLIYYDDPVDQYMAGEDYAFKVLSLKVLFENSAISNFFSQIELMINVLFGSPSTAEDPTHGNNLILNGVYQKHDGHDSYVFVRDGDNYYDMSSEVLDTVEITHAQFITVIPAEGLDPGELMRTKFIMSGRIRFLALPYFDCFSFGKELDADGNVTSDGYLSFANLTIHMDYPPESPEEKAFTFDAGTLAFDLTKSIARPQSLYSHFPLKLSGLTQNKLVESTTPGDLGFISAVSPLNQGGFKKEDEWYGFTYSMDLGTLGALTNEVGFVVTIFLGWKPVSTGYNVYVGVKLPGSKSAAAEIPIQGILKLVFEKIEFTTSEVAANPDIGQAAVTSYMLKFRSIALSLLGFNFPPGQIDMYIFGDPDGSKSAVGWYACYSGDDEAAEESASQQGNLNGGG